MRILRSQHNSFALIHATFYRSIHKMTSDRKHSIPIIDINFSSCKLFSVLWFDLVTEDSFHAENVNVLCLLWHSKSGFPSGILYLLIEWLSSHSKVQWNGKIIHKTTQLENVKATCSIYGNRTRCLVFA